MTGTGKTDKKFHTLQHQISVVFICLLLLSIFTITLINGLFLEKYYVSKKVEVLEEAKEVLSQMNLDDILQYDTDIEEDKKGATDEISDEIERSSSRNNLTWIIVNEENSGYYYWGENNMAKMLRSKLFGYINNLDSGVVFVSYLVTDKELSEAELNSLVFRAYEEPFCIDPNGEYIVYVMLVDENINITYLRSDRITLDNIQPVISGIENGKTYCEAQTVIVDEKYVDTVTVNGTVVTLDADGGFVLPPTNGEQKIVVTDKSGNNAEMTVTVNNGHTFGEWVSDNDGKHTRKCTVDGCDAFETENCSGGNASYFKIF